MAKTRKRSYKIGDRYGLLKITNIIKKDIGNQGRKELFVECQCDCGGKSVTMITRLRRGHTKSCGCLQKKNRIKHNQCNSLAYQSWAAMKQRCDNPKNQRYKDYGGRGITYQKSWRNFINFYQDMGDRPKRKTLDRIDTNGDYCKTNCRWASWREQYDNQRKTKYFMFKGELQTLKKIATKLGVKRGTLYCRLKRGWNEKDALYRPIDRKEGS